ncbi:RILP-like protein 1 [Acropora muricata]|uniref:RILP-like protein 1 n=1 Tax=Acropora muricata TaxID=159855 RepID=UPI0034E433BF
MASDLTTADIYEDASLIGQDFEKIIASFGHEAVVDLMPKIIRVLEKLELVVGEKEKARLEIDELKLENERLYMEITKEASQRRQLDEELYQISASGETENLKTMLAKLQEENRKLRLEYEVFANNQPATAYISAPGDAELMEKMKQAIDNQRDSIRSKNADIDSLRKDLEAMEEQIQRLTTINESVRKTLVASQARVNTLAKEKAELQTELRTLSRGTNVVQLQGNYLDAVDDADPERANLEQQQQVSTEENVENLYGRNHELQQLKLVANAEAVGLTDRATPQLEAAESGQDMDDRGELQELNTTKNAEDEGVENEKGQGTSDKTSQTILKDDKSEVPPPKPPRLQIELDDEKGGDDLWPSNEGRVVSDQEKRHTEEDSNDNTSIEKDEHADWEFIRVAPKVKSKLEKWTEQKENIKDPNRPRYTKAEMLEVLIERNNLKERVFALEDELRIYKPSSYDEDLENQSTKQTTKPRRISRKEDSGISKIFSIFSYHRD